MSGVADPIQEQIDHFNRWVDESTAWAIANGVACCGSDYWTEGEIHSPGCEHYDPAKHELPGWGGGE